MKTLTTLILLSALPLLAQDAAPDPTAPGARIARSLQRAALGSAKTRAFVLGADGTGSAAIETGGECRALSAGSVLPLEADGVAFTARVRSVDAGGIAFECEDGDEPLVIPCSFRVTDPPENAPEEFVNYIETDEVPVDLLLRQVSDRTGANIVASDCVDGKTASLLLRNVSAESAVEEICRACGLWFRRDSATGIFRITTMEEYERNVVSFREERTESFTLLYPNVAEVAATLYGLYPERLVLSLGEDDILEDDQNDVARRFERFKQIADGGGSTFLSMEAPDASTTAGGGRGNGVYSLSREGGLARLGTDASGLTGLTPSEAKRIERAFASGDTNGFDRVYGRGARGADIYVTVSRRNNMLLVRTSDSTALDDIGALVKRLDVPTPMVLLELKVLELTLDDDFTSAFEYGYGQDRSNGRTTDYGFPGFNPLATEPGAGAFSFMYLGHALNARIQMLEEKGNVKTLATPTLLVANNEVSRLFIGEERPIVKNISSQSIVSDNATVTVPQTEIDFEDVGTLLLVTPTINADRTVTLKLLQENSEIVADGAQIPVYSVVSGNAVQNVPVDVVSSRSITGTFIAKDGLAVSAGGLIKETNAEKRSQVPVLGSIPLLGWFFRSTEIVKERRELIVLIRPHVIATPAETELATRALLDPLSKNKTLGRVWNGPAEPGADADAADENETADESSSIDNTENATEK